MAKPTGKSATYFKEKSIEARLCDLIKTTPDGRVRYPDGIDDQTIADELGAKLGSIQRMRRMIWPERELVPQHFRSAALKPAKEPKAKPVNSGTVPEKVFLTQAQYARLVGEVTGAVQAALAADIRRMVNETIDMATAPSRHDGLNAAIDRLNAQ